MVPTSLNSRPVKVGRLRARTVVSRLVLARLASIAALRTVPRAEPVKTIVSVHAQISNSAMNSNQVTPLMIGLILMSLAGCDSPPNKPPRERNDAGRIALRQECYAPNYECSKRCYDRKEQRYCPSCCWQQLILCDEGNPYDFKSCETSETKD